MEKKLTQWYNKIPKMKNIISKGTGSPPPLKKRILIVEDDDPSFFYIKEVLEECGRNFYHVKNGLDAVKIVSEKTDINLILMDILLPEMDGIEATRRIKKLKPEMLIIIESAYSGQEDINRAYEAGCNNYIIKPYTVKTLIDILTQYPDSPHSGTEYS